MEYVIPMVGFFGGWLSFEGPLQQALGHEKPAPRPRRERG